MASDHISPQPALPRPTKSRPWLLAASIYLLYVLLCLTFEGYARHHVNELRLQRIALAEQQHLPIAMMPNTAGDLEKWPPYSFYSTLIGILTLAGAFALAVVCFLKLTGTGTSRPPRVYRFSGLTYVLILPFFAGGFLVMAPRLFADTVCRSVESMTGSHFFFF